jgi:uncharacterized membrane-anchored protein
VRKTIAVVAGLVVLAVADWTILARERLLANGRVVLLELGPRDPRSLMQGDYMALRFALDAVVRRRCRDDRDGRLVVRPDDRGVVTTDAARCDDGSPLAPGEVPIRYRVRADEVRFATNAFFFQEGRGGDYDRARFGEFRVDPSGEMLLTGLRDEHLGALGPAPSR